MKLIFTTKQLLACCAFAFLVSACAPDDAEILPDTTALTATSGSGGNSSKDEEIGTMRYMILTTQDADVTTQLVEAGGSVIEHKAEIGFIIAKSATPAFATKAAAIEGVRSVVKEK